MAYKVEASPAQQFQPLIDWERLPDRGGPRLWAGHPRTQNETPKRGVLKSSHKKLPDAFAFKGALVGCETFRDLVEGLEPAVHQFFPFEIVNKKGDSVPGNHPYYLFNVTQKLDAILVSRSNVIWMDVDKTLAPGKKFLVPGRGPLQLVMSRPKIAECHAWRGDQVFGGDLYFSDALVTAIEAAGLLKLKFTHIEESDDEWRAKGNLAPD